MSISPPIYLNIQQFGLAKFNNQEIEDWFAISALGSEFIKNYKIKCVNKVRYLNTINEVTFKENFGFDPPPTKASIFDL